MPDTTQFTDETKKRLLTIALRIALTFVMRNHVYDFDNQLRKQREGGAIGLELTGLLESIHVMVGQAIFTEMC